MSEPRISDAEVARIVARTPVEFECDATAFENLACDLRDARRDLAALRTRLAAVERERDEVIESLRQSDELRALQSSELVDLKKAYGVQFNEHAKTLGERDEALKDGERAMWDEFSEIHGRLMDADPYPHDGWGACKCSLAAAMRELIPLPEATRPTPEEPAP